MERNGVEIEMSCLSLKNLLLHEFLDTFKIDYESTILKNTVYFCYKVAIKNFGSPYLFLMQFIFIQNRKYSSQ